MPLKAAPGKPPADKSFFKSAWHLIIWSNKTTTTKNNNNHTSTHPLKPHPYMISFVPVWMSAAPVCSTVSLFTCGEMHSRQSSVWCSKLHLARCYHSCTVLLNTALCCSAMTQPVSRSNNAFQHNQLKHMQEGNVLFYSTVFLCSARPLREAFCWTFIPL